MAITARAAKFGKLSGDIATAKGSAKAIVRRAMIEADVKTKKDQSVIDAIGGLFDLAGSVAETREDYKTAKRGGFEGGFYDFLTQPEESGKSIQIGQAAKEKGENVYYDVNNNTFVDVSEKLNLNQIERTFDATEKALGRDLTLDEREEAFTTMRNKEFITSSPLNVRELETMGIDTGTERPSILSILMSRLRGSN
jgi:hypothetical protein